MRFDVSALSPEELVVLIADAKRALYPEAVIVGNELECSACHERGTPELIEDGMTVTHHIERLSESEISARGWDGSSSDVSEEGIPLPCDKNTVSVTHLDRLSKC